MKGTQIIRSHLFSFLNQVVRDARPHWIVAVERKGTALLRSWIDQPAVSTVHPFRWNRVLSTEIVDDLNPGIFDNQRVLILDDSVQRGETCRKAQNSILKLSPSADVSVAAFLVHKDCPSPVHYYWFNELGDKRYKELREEVAQYLQDSGSLLLDTEHIEVPIELMCSRVEFFDSLRALGDAVEFLSHGQRVNLTIYNPLLPDEDKFLQKLPNGTVIDGCVKKIRVVERKGNVFSIIPIFYPSIPRDLESGWQRHLPECLHSGIGSPLKNFYIVGLYSAIELLKAVFASLRDLRNDGKIHPFLPMPGEEGDPLSHLKPLYPQLDTRELHNLVQTSIEQGHTKKRRKKDRKEGRYLVEGASLNISYYGGQIRNHVQTVSDSVLYGPSVATAKEVLKALPGKEYIASAALDREIDRAKIATGVTSDMCQDGIYRLFRYFRISSEIDAADLRKSQGLDGDPTENYGPCVVAACRLFGFVLNKRLESARKQGVLKQDTLDERDADKTIRLMAKIWRVLRRNRIDVSPLPVKDIDALHGRRSAFTAYQPPSLEQQSAMEDRNEWNGQISVLDTMEHFSRMKLTSRQNIEIIERDEDWWKTREVRPLLNESDIMIALNKKQLTLSDINLARDLGHALGALTSEQIECIGRHENAENTYSSILFQFKVWTIHIRKALDNLRIIHSTSDNMQIDKVARSVWRAQTFAREAVKKADKDRKDYAEAFNQLVTCEIDSEGNIQNAIKEIQTKTEGIWENSRVSRMAFPAYLCHRFTMVILGVLIQHPDHNNSITHKIVSQQEVINFSEELRYLLSIDPKMRPVAFSEELLHEQVGSASYNARIPILPVTEIWSNQITFTEFVADCERILGFINENYIEPCLQESRDY